MYVMLRKRGDSPNRAIRVIILPKVYYDFSQWARNQRKSASPLIIFGCSIVESMGYVVERELSI